MFSLRLTGDNRDKLVADFLALRENGISLKVCCIETYSIKDKKDIAMHGHGLYSVRLSEQTLRSRIKALGYRGGTMYHLDDNAKKGWKADGGYRYICKGRARGDIDVPYIDEGFANDWNNLYWDTHTEVEGKRKQSPIYIQIADHIVGNLADFTTFEPGNTEAFKALDESDQLDAENHTNPYFMGRKLLDVAKVFKYAIKRYSENGPLFDPSVIERVYYMVQGKLNSEQAGSRFAGISRIIPMEL